ncbi:hypothetical protein [Leptospira licerasiae]|uniref:hypothetical protein n=1 Tax=Leptospira licerasiae TaxID=447106 RepID=UPI003018EECF
MLADFDNFPKIGTKGLIIRVPEDIEHDNEGFVYPLTGGLSTFLNIMDMPKFYIPVALGGKGRIPIYKIRSENVHSDLRARSDNRENHDSSHILIEPVNKILIDHFNEDIICTRELWEIEHR